MRDPIIAILNYIITSSTKLQLVHEKFFGSSDISIWLFKKKFWDDQTICLMILNKSTDILQNHQQCLMGQWLFVNTAIGLVHTYTSWDHLHLLHHLRQSTLHCWCDTWNRVLASPKFLPTEWRLHKPNKTYRPPSPMKYYHTHTLYIYHICIC